MELAGFYISPAERLRVLKVLEGFSQDNLRSPEKLKHLLCPIIAQGKADQEKFYELFDQYWTQIEQPWEIQAEEETKPTIGKNLDWLRWLIVALAAAGLVYAALKIDDTVPEPMKVHFSHPEEVVVGNTLRFENNSANFDSLCTFKWEILDFGYDKVVYENEDSFDLEYQINEVGESDIKKVRLTFFNPKNNESAFYESEFRIICNAVPKLQSVEASTSANVNEKISFGAFFTDTVGLKVSWELGDRTSKTPGVEKNGISVEHSFNEIGVYDVRLIATREGVEGHCRMDTVFKVSVGTERAHIAGQALYEDTITPIVNFSIGMWVLMGLVGLGLLWFWMKWASREAPVKEKADEIDLESAAKRFKSSDRAPYKIPFRSNVAFIRADKDLYRLADVMRQRQEGLRREMDVPSSVKRTVAEGGFPHLLTKSDTVPTEYLYLIEEENQISHLKHLKEWVVDFLRQREVIGEVFYFKNDLQRFWNANFPNGISREQLKRHYAWHKLVVLGKGHGWIDTTQNFDQQQPILGESANKLFRHWKQRFLLTSNPVVSWTYREGILHDLFAIFPMDTAGLTSLAKYIEHDVLDEERPPYASWSDRLLENRVEPDINYRRWRTASDHREYLKGYPHLYQWLCALAVYPNPEWNLTLAIGRVLPGIEVTYDHLLLLSRVPWLSGEELSPRLRHELLENLDPDLEKLAREAVEVELSAIQEIVKDGHANLEHQVNLVTTQFVLHPEDPQAQLAMNQLMALNLLTPRNYTEINQGLVRHRSGGNKAVDQIPDYIQKEGSFSVESDSEFMHFPASPNKDPKPIQAFLKENKPEPERLPKPFFTKDFWRAAALSWLFIMLFMMGWNLGGTSKLAEIAGVDIAETADCQEEYLFAYILKKQCFADSAVFLNNEAVGIIKNMAKDASPATMPLLRDVNELKIKEAESLFLQAINMRPNYDLPKINMEKLQFNLGMHEYHAYLIDSSDYKGLQKAADYYRKVTIDSLYLHRLHGLGLVSYHLENDAAYLIDNPPPAPPANSSVEQGGNRRNLITNSGLNASLFQNDSSQIFYRLLLDRDSTFFDTLSTYPHLQSLLAGKLLPQPVEVYVKDVDSGQALSSVLVSDGELRLRTSRTGRVTVAMRPGERRSFSFTLEGYESRTVEIRSSTSNAPIEVVMSKLASQVAFKLVFILTDAATNQPIRGATVRLVWSVDGGNALVFESDDRGRVDIETEDGSFTRLRLDVLIEQDGYESFRMPLNLIQAEVKANGGRLLLKKERSNTNESSYSGTVVDFNDQPLSGIKIKAIGADIETITDINGNFTINIPQGIDIKGVEVDEKEQVFDRRRIIRLDYYSGGLEQRPPQNSLDIDRILSELDQNMVYVEGGTFMMGCDPERDGACKDNELPLHQTDLPDFYINRYEVTQAQWEAVMKENPSKFNDCPNCPVEIVSWNDIQDFLKILNKLSEQNGKRYRLPTEAEWEYSARGGKRSKGYVYSGSNNLNAVAWYNDGSGSKTHPVGQKQANELGLYDMSGNVWEWCQDWYGEEYYQQFKNEPAKAPVGPNSGENRVVRGGSYGSYDWGCRVAERNRFDSSDRVDRVGFRLACTPRSADSGQ